MTNLIILFLIIFPTFLGIVIFKLKRLPIKFALDPLNILFQLIFMFPICLAFIVTGLFFSYVPENHLYSLNPKTPIAFLLDSDRSLDIFKLASDQIYKWILFYLIFVFVYWLIINLVTYLIEKYDGLFNILKDLDMIDEEKFMLASLDRVIIDVDLMTNDGNWIYCGRAIKPDDKDIGFHDGIVTLKNVLKVDKASSYKAYAELKREAMLSKSNSQNILKKMAFPKNNITSINFRVSESISKKKIRIPKA